jgi:hypothetical protein
VSNEGSLISALTIGTSREVLTASPQSPLSKLLQELTQDVIDQLTKRIEHYDIEGTNNLKQSIKPTKVQNKGGQIDIGITADFYWKFVNYGVNGTEVNMAHQIGEAHQVQSLSKKALQNGEQQRV